MDDQGLIFGRKARTSFGSNLYANIIESRATRRIAPHRQGAQQDASRQPVQVHRLMDHGTIRH
jgi:hypothetical protein